jgi:hypothetical protein
MRAGSGTTARVARLDWIRDGSSRFLPNLMLTELFFSMIALISFFAHDYIAGTPPLSRMTTSV